MFEKSQTRVLNHTVTKHDIKKCLPDILITKILANIKVKGYNNIKKDKQQQMIEENAKEMRRKLNLRFERKSQLLKTSLKIDMADFGVEDEYLKSLPIGEIAIVDEFLDRFVFVSQTSSVVELDLKLALKALPPLLTPENIHRIDMIDFPIIQKSLIAF